MCVVRSRSTSAAVIKETAEVAPAAHVRSPLSMHGRGRWWACYCRRVLCLLCIALLGWLASPPTTGWSDGAGRPNPTRWVCAADLARLCCLLCLLVQSETSSYSDSDVQYIYVHVYHRFQWPTHVSPCGACAQRLRLPVRTSWHARSTSRRRTKVAHEDFNEGITQVQPKKKKSSLNYSDFFSFFFFSTGFFHRCRINRPCHVFFPFFFWPGARSKHSQRRQRLTRRPVLQMTHTCSHLEIHTYTHTVL